MKRKNCCSDVSESWGCLVLLLRPAGCPRHGKAGTTVDCGIRLPGMMSGSNHDSFVMMLDSCCDAVSCDVLIYQLLLTFAFFG